MLELEYVKNELKQIDSTLKTIYFEISHQNKILQLIIEQLNKK